MLIAINTLDNILTYYYVFTPADEKFFVMKWAIGVAGVAPSLFVGKIVLFLFIFFCILKRYNETYRVMLWLVTVGYITEMLGWLVYFNFVKLPQV